MPLSLLHQPALCPHRCHSGLLLQLLSSLSTHISLHSSEHVTVSAPATQIPAKHSAFHNVYPACELRTQPQYLSLLVSSLYLGRKAGRRSSYGLNSYLFRVRVLSQTGDTGAFGGFAVIQPRSLFSVDAVLRTAVV